MPLEPTHKALIESYLEDPEAISAIFLGLCWNESILASEARLDLHPNESLSDASLRHKLGWNPAWLTEAGFTAYDSAGTALEEESHTQGQMHWDPPVRTHRLDDKVKDTATGHSKRRRIGGEIAVLSLWTHVVTSRNVSIERPCKLDRNLRGARFRDLLIHFLSKSLPTGWQVRHEVPLTHIRGLHMRRDVGDRKSDILIIDEGGRLVAALSSKWTWRSDRGTEAAQMVPLTRYRPDVPYAMATAEFPRAAGVARESIEDRTYHICPGWVGSWMAVNELAADASALARWPDLAALKQEGINRAQTLALNGLDVLVKDLRNSGDIL
ncbi:hypothetical protein [Streptomyces sp. 11x1]|uniref:hypothetical protein n=1 Tax=Streptomyces sp. 11x1 TaxID=3038642 RepID=UPI00292E783F|nr:hypothetical protein [Streptomyces sp. 11x1]WNZ11195.1 hypothetical protein P8T65_29015 [Streptomyces sp. 11x1]